MSFFQLQFAVVRRHILKVQFDVARRAPPDQQFWAHQRNRVPTADRNKLTQHVNGISVVVQMLNIL